MKNKTKINILFFGTSYFSQFFLKKLIKNKFFIQGIVTKKEKFNHINPVKQTALKYNIKHIFQPISIYELKKLKKNIIKININLIIIVSYGFIIPSNIINIPKFGCINIHPSLLPKLRGPCPIHTAILKGYTKTGISFIKINNKIDAGDIIYQKICPISYKDTYQSLTTKLQNLGIKCIIKIIKQLKHNIILKKIKQNSKLATYTKKINKNDGKINWNKDKSINIIRKIKAYHIWPKTFCYYKKNKIIIWKAKQLNISTNNIKPGKILEYNNSGLKVTTKDYLINIYIIQLNSSKKMYVSEIIKSKPEIFKIGDFLN